MVVRLWICWAVVSGMLGHTAGFLLAYPNLLQSWYACGTGAVSELTKPGKCDTKRDTHASNNSLYVTAALDILGDVLSESGLPVQPIPRLVVCLTLKLQ